MKSLLLFVLIQITLSSVPYREELLFEQYPQVINNIIKPFQDVLQQATGYDEIYADIKYRKLTSNVTLKSLIPTDPTQQLEYFLEKLSVRKPVHPVFSPITSELSFYIDDYHDLRNSKTWEYVYSKYMYYYAQGSINVDLQTDSDILRHYFSKLSVGVMIGLDEMKVAKEIVQVIDSVQKYSLDIVCRVASFFMECNLTSEEMKEITGTAQTPQEYVEELFNKVDLEVNKGKNETDNTMCYSYDISCHRLEVDKHVKYLKTFDFSTSYDYHIQCRKLLQNNTYENLMDYYGVFLEKGYVPKMFEECLIGSIKTILQHPDEYNHTYYASEIKFILKSSWLPLYMLDQYALYLYDFNPVSSYVIWKYLSDFGSSFSSINLIDWISLFDLSSETNEDYLQYHYDLLLSLEKSMHKKDYEKIQSWKTSKESMLLFKMNQTEKALEIMQHSVDQDDVNSILKMILIYQYGGYTIERDMEKALKHINLLRFNVEGGIGYSMMLANYIVDIIYYKMNAHIILIIIGVIILGILKFISNKQFKNIDMN